MDNMQDLLEREKDLMTALRLVQEDIAELKEQEALPALRKKYEGKYFTYRNSYSLPKKEADYWLVYFHVRQVVGVNQFEVFRFQTTRDGEMTCEIKVVSEWQLETKISKRHYDKYKNKFVNAILKIAECTATSINDI